MVKIKDKTIITGTQVNINGDYVRGNVKIYNINVNDNSVKKRCPLCHTNLSDVNQIYCEKCGNKVK